MKQNKAEMRQAIEEELFDLLALHSPNVRASTDYILKCLEELQPNNKAQPVNKLQGVKDLLENMKDIDPEIQSYVNGHFWEILNENPVNKTDNEARAEIMELLWVFSCDATTDPKEITERIIDLAQYLNPKPQMDDEQSKNIGQKELVEKIEQIVSRAAFRKYGTDMQRTNHVLELSLEIAALLPSSPSRENGVNVGLLEAALEELTKIRNQYQVIDGEYVIQLVTIDNFIQEQKQAIESVESQLKNK